MSVKDDFAPYRDPYGFVHPGPFETGGPSDNGPRFTGEFVQCLINHGELTEDECVRLSYNLEHQFESPSGNLWRYPGRKAQQQIDDVVAALYWDQMVGGEFAKRWLERGRSVRPKERIEVNVFDKHWAFKYLAWPIMRFFRLNGYSYTTSQPDKFTTESWFGRFPQVVAHAKICNGEKLSLWNTFSWCLVIYLGLKKKKYDQDAWVLSWYLIKAAKNYPSWIIQHMRKLWIAKFKGHWPNGLGDVLISYFGKKQPSGKYLQGEFGE